MTPNRLQWIASTSLIALIFLCLGWELWLAPLRPGGSWLALKAVLLLAPLFGILRGKRYTYQWTSLFVLFYVMEGSMRASSDHGLSQTLAIIETGLSLVLFAAVVAYARITRPAQKKPPDGGLFFKHASENQYPCGSPEGSLIKRRPEP